MRSVAVLVLEYIFLDDLGVKLGNAVYAVRSAYAQECHVDLVVLDNGHSGNLVSVAKALHKLLAVTAVDLADNVEDTGSDLADKVNVPLLQSLSHNGVVGVSEGVGNDVPALVPAVAAVIEENTHKLGDSKSGVSIVDVDSYLLVEVIEGAVNAHMAVYDIANGSCAHKVLLTVSEALALEVVIVGVKYLGDSLCNSVLAESLSVVALIEHSHIKGRSLCLPQSQNGNAIAVVAGNIHIVRNSNNGAVVLVGNVVVLLIPVFLKLAVEMNFDGLIGLGNKPALAAGKPVIGKLCLPAVLYLLLEDTVLVADGVAHCRIAVGSKTVKVAGSKSAQAAVSETCIRLVIVDTVNVNVPLLEDIRYHVVYFKVIKACLERTSHKELHGKVVYFLLSCRMYLIAELSSLFSQQSYNDCRKCLVDLIIGSVDRSDICFVLKLLTESLLKIFLIDYWRHDFFPFF